ncbi:Uncharacterized protein Rs2_09900 [Raphanus sativus]|nr:Uncharacterized protein Rs2_09900 [Raphanus sativus]
MGEAITKHEGDGTLGCRITTIGVGTLGCRITTIGVGTLRYRSDTVIKKQRSRVLLWKSRGRCAEREWGRELVIKFERENMRREEDHKPTAEETPISTDLRLRIDSNRAAKASAQESSHQQFAEKPNCDLQDKLNAKIGDMRTTLNRKKRDTA